MMGLRKQILSRLKPILWPVYRWYMYTKKIYDHKGIRLRLRPTVFHPAFFLSTTYLLEYILQLDLMERRFLELGAGSGLISLHAAKCDAVVTASDVNPTAVQSIEESQQMNQLSFTVLQSDLFDEIPLQVFDLIVINPPYYPKEPQNDWELAFYCGTGHAYFHRLFKQIGHYMNAESQIIMILSQDCQIDQIQSIAKKSGFTWDQKDQRRIQGEWNFIFEISLGKA